MTEIKDADTSWRNKLAAIYRALTFRPLFAAGVLGLSVIAAILEGVGMSYLLPILRLAQGEVHPSEATGALGFFVDAYAALGIPFRLGYLVGGVSLIMTLRYSASFVVGWLGAAIETYYVRHLQQRGFNSALDADIAYFEREGSDDILNAIVTQSEYAGKVIRRTIATVEQSLLSLMYLGVAFMIAPLLTAATTLVMGGIVLLYRQILETGYTLGDRVADANEKIQSSAQAGTQGIREVKLFGLESELRSKFSRAVDQFATARIQSRRNQEGINNFYEFAVAVTIFVLIYLALTYFSLPLSSLGVFLFAMFRLGPRVSHFNRRLYALDSELPHLVRTQEFIHNLDRSSEPVDSDGEALSELNEIRFENVEFSYESTDETVLKDVSFPVDRNEFIAFVGSSGAGKSTIAALIARFYRPDSGEILADGKPIEEVDLQSWRSRISFVGQNPYIFNDTLRWNVTVGNREVDEEEIDRACDIAQVTEFIDDLPDGYDTVLGDDGVRLSGGQRQRVAIARALLKDADFLILDEATSDLDSTLEQKVHKGIENLDRNYGMLVIAHRLSTVVNADRIHTLKNGRIVEEGKHDELTSGDGIYANLYDSQTESKSIEQ